MTFDLIIYIFFAGIILILTSLIFAGKSIETHHIRDHLSFALFPSTAKSERDKALLKQYRSHFIMLKIGCYAVFLSWILMSLDVFVLNP